MHVLHFQIRHYNGELADIPLEEYADDWSRLKSRFIQLHRNRINSFTFSLSELEFDFSALSRFPPRGDFVLKSGHVWITLNHQNRLNVLGQVDAAMLRALDIGDGLNQPGSNTSFFDEVREHGIITVYHKDHSREFQENYGRAPRPIRRRRGQWFPFAHTIEGLDLRRYQIFHKDDVQTDETACLIFALQKTKKCPEEVIEHLQGVVAMVSRTVSMARLKSICLRFKINITVYSLRKKGGGAATYKKDVTQYPDSKTNFPINVKICLMHGHYFVYDEDSGISASALRDSGRAARLAMRRTVEGAAVQSWWKVKVRSQENYLDSFNLVKKLLTLKKKQDSQSTNIDPEAENHDLLYLDEMSRQMETSRLRNYLSLKREFKNLTLTDEDVAPYGVRPGVDESVAEGIDRVSEKKQRMIDGAGNEQQQRSALTRKKMLFAFDFETTTDGETHRPYMACLQRIMDPQFDKPLADIKLQSAEFPVLTFTGPNCGRDLLQSACGIWKKHKKEYRAGVQLIAHNAGYDLRFLFAHFSKLFSPEIVRAGVGNLKSFKGCFVYDQNMLSRELNSFKTGKKRGSNKQLTFGFKSRSNAIITVHDSLNFTMCPLSSFPKMFELGAIEKEIMPYDAYTNSLFDMDKSDPTYGMRRLEAVKESLYQKALLKPKSIYAVRTGLQQCEQKDVAVDASKFADKFHSNAVEWGCVHRLGGEDYVDLIKYSKVYCERDVIILSQGYCKLRHMFYTVSNGLDMDNCVSVNQLTNKALQEYGCTEGVVELSGVVRDFIQQCVTGGKCMLRNNEKQHVKGQVIADFDAVSLYPSAMAEMPGLLLGGPKIIPEGSSVQDMEALVGGGSKGAWFAQVAIKSVGRHWQMPICNYYDHETKKRTFTNDMVGKTMWCSNITIQDMMEMQDITVDIIKGYYFDQGYNTKIGEFITEIFEERLKMKKTKNPMQLVYKLMMNGAYGRLILKPIETDSKFVRRDVNFRAYLKREWELIKSFEEMPPECPFSHCVEMYKEVYRHWSAPHLGVMILDYSKRIMNRLHKIAHEMKMPIYYMDTDSMHLLDDDIKKMTREFKVQYPHINNGELIGKKLGQFHNDFGISPVGPVSLPSFDESDIRSSEFLAYGKKCYIHCLHAPCKQGEKKDADRVYGNALAMKGFTQDSVYDTCNRFEISLEQLYQNVFDGEAYVADLLAGSRVSFEFNRQMQVKSRTHMYRTIRCVI